MTACREFAKWPLRASESMRKKIFGYDETKTELFCLTARYRSWQSDQRLSKRRGTAQHVLNIILTMERGKKFNQSIIGSFPDKRICESLSTAQCTLQTDTAECDDMCRCKL